MNNDDTQNQEPTTQSSDELQPQNAALETPQPGPGVVADQPQEVIVHNIGLSKHKKQLITALVIVLLCIVVAAIAVLLTQSNKGPATNTQSTQTPAASVAAAEVSITSGTFVPATIQVSVGQAVVWKNDDTADHQIAADPYPTNTSLPDLGKGEVLKPGDTFTYQYEKAGTYTYHDNLNPYKIKGTVIVK